MQCFTKIVESEIWLKIDWRCVLVLYDVYIFPRIG